MRNRHRKEEDCCRLPALSGGVSFLSFFLSLERQVMRARLRDGCSRWQTDLAMALLPSGLVLGVSPPPSLPYFYSFPDWSNPLLILSSLLLPALPLHPHLQHLAVASRYSKLCVMRPPFLPFISIFISTSDLGPPELFLLSSFFIFLFLAVPG